MLVAEICARSSRTASSRLRRASPAGWIPGCSADGPSPPTPSSARRAGPRCRVRPDRSRRRATATAPVATRRSRDPASSPTSKCRSSASGPCASGTSATDKPTAGDRQAPYASLGPLREHHVDDGYSPSQRRPPHPQPTSDCPCSQGVSVRSPHGEVAPYATQKRERSELRVS